MKFLFRRHHVPHPESPRDRIVNRRHTISPFGVQMNALRPLIP